MTEPECWTELNIWPAEGMAAGVLLAYVAVPLIASVADSLDGTHFFWERQSGVAGGDGPQTGTHLRLRLRWLDADNAAEALPRVAKLLDDHDMVGRWFTGAHGVEGEVYEGEAAEYGDAWLQVSEVWETSSDLVLQVAVMAMESRTPWEHMSWRYIDRTVHCVINQFARDDVALHLELAHAYLSSYPQLWPGAAEMVPVLESWRVKYFNGKPSEREPSGG